MRDRPAVPGAEPDGVLRTGTQRARIPKDVRCPAFLIMLNFGCTKASIIIAYVTFAIYFLQEHDWSKATWAGIAQTVGDFIAAVNLQMIPVLFPSSYDPDEAGCVRRSWHRRMSEPYNLSFTLATWFLFKTNVVAISAKWDDESSVALGADGHHICLQPKWSSDMNLFYALGDPVVFLSLQVMCRNALGGVLGTWLYTLDPLLPFTCRQGWLASRSWCTHWDSAADWACFRMISSWQRQSVPCAGESETWPCYIFLSFFCVYFFISTFFGLIYRYRIALLDTIGSFMETRRWSNKAI